MSGREREKNGYISTQTQTSPILVKNCINDVTPLITHQCKSCSCGDERPSLDSSDCSGGRRFRTVAEHLRKVHDEKPATRMT